MPRCWDIYATVRRIVLSWFGPVSLSFYPSRNYGPKPSWWNSRGPSEPCRFAEWFVAASDLDWHRSVCPPSAKGWFSRSFGRYCIAWPYLRDLQVFPTRKDPLANGTQDHNIRRSLPWSRSFPRIVIISFNCTYLTLNDFLHCSCLLMNNFTVDVMLLRLAFSVSQSNCN